MLMTTDSNISGILPSKFNSLMIDPILEESIPFSPAVSTSVHLGEGVHDFRAPILREDVAADWVAEGQEIAPSDPEFDEIRVVPSKVAALTIISSETARDTSPQAQQIVGSSIARALTAKINQAFLSAVASPAPSGLAQLTDVTEIAAGAKLANLDPFAQAVAALEALNRKATAFLVSPAEALALATIKVGKDQATPLLTDPRAVLGRPVIVSASAPAGTMYAIDSSTTFAVLGHDVEIAFSQDAFFTSDRVAVRGTARVGFGFADPASVARITLG